MVLHSFLLVPYHSWRISHGMHHQSTGHLIKDQVFVPPVKARWEKRMMKIRNSVFYHAFSEAPVYYVTTEALIMFLAGWQTYLLVNTTSGQKYDRWASHFHPSSPIFKDSQRHLVVLSDLGIAAMFCALTWFAYSFGWSSLIFNYLMPYLWCNFWLILITYLQHTDPQVPYYNGDEEWTFVRGALSTIDRNYGPVLNHLFHHIGDTHVLHHLFSKIPHYHALEASNAIKPLLGEHYKCSSPNTSLFASFWQSKTTCHYVDPLEGPIMFPKKGK
jgi:omega-6 fatty acid desaturase (delta-12 desaturase)